MASRGGTWKLLRLGDTLDGSPSAGRELAEKAHRRRGPCGDRGVDREARNRHEWGDELWDRCYQELMANTRARPAQEIKVGSRVYYDQTAGIPAGLLDSIVVLDAGNGNRAVGRCNLDLTTARGLCTFSDGTGRFAGVKARVEVSPPAGGRRLALGRDVQLQSARLNRGLFLLWRPHAGHR